MPRHLDLVKLIRKGNNFYFQFEDGAQMKASMQEVLLWEILVRSNKTGE